MEHKKIAVIIGVRNDRSIALAVAKKLHSQGVRVAVSYTDNTKEDVLHYLEQANIATDLTGLMDVTNDQEVANFLSSVYEKAGAIDYIFHSVAFGSNKVLCNKLPFSNEEAPEYIDMPWEDLQEAIDIGAYSLLRITRSALPYLSESASLLTTTYNASQRVIPKYAGMAIVKACLENTMHYLAHFLGEKGHRINALSPGLIMTTSAASIQGVRAMRKQSAELSPLGNVKLEDVSAAAAYYFSDASKRITGNIHYIDGGLNIMGG